MSDSKIKHLLNDVIGHSHMYHKQYHIYRDKPQLFGYKKNWIRGTKLLEGNRYSLFSSITSATFWNIKTPIFFPFSNSKFLSNCTVKLTFTNVGAW